MISRNYAMGTPEVPFSFFPIGIQKKTPGATQFSTRIA
jgi:hypothetical protein